MEGIDRPSCDVRCIGLEVDDLLRRSEQLLSATDSTLEVRGEPGLKLMITDLAAADHALRTAERVLKHHLKPLHENWRTGEPLILLLEVQTLRLAIRDSRIHRRSVTTAELHRSLRRIRSELSVTALFGCIPAELGRIGFSRSLLSGLRGTSWTARSAFVHSDSSLADALVKLGNAVPGKIGREEPETEMFRQRSPVLVRDAQSKQRIHRELITLADTRDYVAAPVIAHGSIIAVLHADRHSQADSLDTFDRDLIGLFCEGAGLAIERALYQERFVALKRQFERQANDIDDLLYGNTQWANGFGSGPAPDESTVVQAGSTTFSDLYEGATPLHDLTRRETQVLRHLAGGASNQDIATRLGVSTGTVKTHMKNILRKLGAANRSEAAAIFHHLARANSS